MATPFLHPVSANVVPRPIVFSREFEERSLREDHDILERIVAAYHRAIRPLTVALREQIAGPIWGGEGYEGQQAELIEALERSSLSRLHTILKQFFITDSAHAIALGRQEADLIRHHIEHEHCYGLQWIDRLAGLAFAVGAVSLPNPEDELTRDWERCLEVDPEELVSRIEAHLGLALAHPNICGVFGGRLREAAFPFLAFQHLLVALNLRDLVTQPEPTIVEIGGGYGGLAYCACQLIASKYYIFDLPYASAVQAYFLYRAQSTHAIVLCGEACQSRHNIHLLPAWSFGGHEPACTDAVVSQNCLLEVPEPVVVRYLNAIKCILRGPFLSIHPEAPYSARDVSSCMPVGKLINRVGGFSRASRDLFPLQLGHVKEVFYPHDFQPTMTIRRLLAENRALREKHGQA